MSTTRPFPVVVVVALVAAIGCSTTSGLGEIQGFGPNPVLPPPATSLIPTTNVVKAIGWKADATPTAAPGSSVVAFARGLDHPRWLYVLPNGDVLVAETNGPPGAGNVKGIRRWFYNRYQQKSGNATPSANRITLLRDADADGVAETRVTFLTGLSSPLGMALIGDTLYIANHDAVVRVPYTTGTLQVAARPVKVFDLPSLPPEHHWTKNIIASADGLTLYAAVGSNSNVAEEGLDKEVGRAAIWAFDLPSGSSRVFASGLRNPVGLAWVEENGLLWTAVNERDEIGNDLVPDYITSVRQGGFYGWPYSYYGSHVDERVKPQRPDLVATAIVPDYAVGSHTASLGLAYSRSNALPAPFQNGMFVGQHGSWNRKPRSGYKVIFVPFSGGRPSGPPIDVLTGFVTANGDAMGRPVGVALDAQGALLVADDVGNAVWRVTSAGRLSRRGMPSGAAAQPAMCAIDMGSNSFRRIVGSFADGRYVQAQIESKTMGIGDDVVRHGRISDGKLAEIDETLAGFRASCQTDGAANVVAVGTAAFRDAPNGSRVVEMASKHGIRMEIATEQRESELAYLVGSLGRDGYAVIDNGSRSVELVAKDTGLLRFLVFHDGYRLAYEEFFAAAENPAAAYAAFRDRLLQHARNAAFMSGKKTLVGIEFEEMADVLFEPAPIEGRVFTRQALLKRLDQITREPAAFQGLKATKDIDRALPRLVVAAVLTEAFGYSQIELTGRQLGAGLIIEAGLRRERP